jgi:hypothetical protein
MGNKNIRLHRQFREQGLGQGKNPGACIQNHQRAIIATDFNAGGIAAIYHRALPWRSD